MGPGTNPDKHLKIKIILTCSFLMAMGGSQDNLNFKLFSGMAPGSHPTNHLKIKIILTFSYLH